jgi:hypothetical protein
VIASEAIARIPHDAALWGGVAAGIAGTAVVGSTLTTHGVDPRSMAMVGVGGGLGLTALGVGSIDAVARMRGPIVDRYVVNGMEQVARSTMELRWGIAGARLVAVSMGVGLGAFVAGTGFATSGHARS